jgi:A/G-specific adenine glycosylase
VSAEKTVSARLLEWFKEHGRRYPWRENASPYRVLVAEIMLQRTKAEQVLPVYLSFLKEFPTVQKLDEGRVEDVRKYFSRLGLMWRAGLVKRLAREIIIRHCGKIPDSREELLSLPSVGEYMADAVLSFAYGRDVAVVDANVCRVIGRVFGLKPRGEARRDRMIREMAQRMVPEGRSREFNWAMIDLAALICTPRKPRCPECPLEEVCSYRRGEAS